jgi:anthranilate phosphoribosyltransferase
LKQDSIYSYTITPEDIGISRAPLHAIRGGSAEDNVAVMNRVLSGERGPARDIVLLNAAAALAAGDATKNLRQGIMQASEAIDSGRALEKLRSLARLSQKLT